MSLTEKPESPTAQAEQEDAPEASRPPIRPVALVAIVLALALVAAVVLLGLTGFSTTNAVSVDDQVVLSGDPVAVLDVEVIGMDVARGVQQVLVLPIPRSDSGLFSAETRLLVERDGLPPAIFTFAPGATIFPAQFEVAAVGGRNDYPWDRYQSQLQMTLDEGQGTEALPVQADVDTSLSGWRIATTLTNDGTDTLTMGTQAARAAGPIAVAALQFVAILLVGLLLAAVTVDNLQKRRAAFGSAFAALNALVFLTVIRTLMPNSPPVGIRLDFAFTYPALLLATTAMLTLVVLFLTQWIPARLRGEVPGGSMTFG